MAKPQKRAAAAESAGSKKKKSKVEEEDEDEEEEDYDEEEDEGDDDDDEEAKDNDEEEDADDDAEDDGGDDDEEEDDDDDDEDEGQKAWSKVEKKVVAMEKDFKTWKQSGGSSSFDHKGQLKSCQDAIEEYLSVCCYSGGDDAEAWENRLDTLNLEYVALNKKTKKK